VDPRRVEHRQLRVLGPDQHGDFGAAEDDAASAPETFDLLDAGGFRFRSHLTATQLLVAHAVDQDASFLVQNQRFDPVSLAQATGVEARHAGCLHLNGGGVGNVDQG
jgi:hypothetical protein